MEEFKSNWIKFEEKKKEWLKFYKENDQYKDICWSVNRGHIVWLDGTDLQNDIAYDITGVYKDYEELRPISYLGTTIVDFLHNDKKWESNDQEFKKYCKEKNVEEIYEIETIWMQIPKEELLKYDRTNLTLPEVALDYWRKNR